MIHYSVLALWYLATAACMVCLGSLLWKRLARTYVLFSFWVALQLLVSLWLMSVYFRGGGDAYAAAWQTAHTLEMLLQVGVIIEAYILQARHCRRFLLAGAIVAAFFAAVSALLVASMAGFASKSLEESDAVVLASRHVDLLSFLFLRFSVWFFKFSGVEIRPNTRRHVTILSITTFGGAVTYAMYHAGPHWMQILAQFVNLGLCSACYILWSVKLTRAGEVWEAPPRMTAEEYAAEIRACEQIEKGVLAGTREMREALATTRRLPG